MSLFKTSLALGLSSLLVVSSASAATSSSKKKKKKTATTSAAVKKKTVGELLRQADRGADLRATEKSATAIPNAQDLFKGSRRSTPAENLSQVKPPRTASFYEDGNSDKAKLERITDQQISELYHLTQRFKTSPQRGELWLRLAELYVEKAGLIDFRKEGEYDQALKEYEAGKRKIKPRLDLHEPHEYNNKAIQLYEWFVRDFPKDDKIDQALFFLGYNYYELGNLKRGTEFYTRLAKEYPHSPYVIEANFALGEYYFDAEKWDLAKKYYAQVLRYKRHRLFGFSLYKTAWAEFRTGHSQKALHLMEALIRQGREQAAQAALEGRKNINRNRLDNEGLRDIVLFYADIGDPQKAPDYFHNLTDNNPDDYIEKLAYYYGDKGNLAGARYLFNYLISVRPTSPKAFDYKYQIVRLYAPAKQSREFREEMFSWVKDFAPGSEWANANAGNKDLMANSYKLRETTLRNYVLQEHQTAQNSRAPYSQNLALEGYRLYLSEFTDSPVIADMHFYFGELLYDMKKFEDAGAQYRWVAENGKGSKFYSRALENTVLALEKGLPSDAEIAKRVGKSVEPVPLDPHIENFITAVLAYIHQFPSNEKAAEMKFRVGRLYYQHNQFDQAIPYFKEIVMKHPKTKYAEYSANLLLDIYNLKKDYAGLEKTGKELLANPTFADSQAGKDVKGVMEKANFKKAQDLEVAKNYGDSAAQYEAFARQNPGSELASMAIFNAAINYERAGEDGKAIAMHKEILSRGKSADQFKQKSRRIVAKLYQSSGQLDEAASEFQACAAEAGKDPLAPNLYFNAAILYEAIGRNADAIRNYEAYREKERKSDKNEALYLEANLYRKQGSLSKAVEKYQDYVQAGTGSKEKIVESAYWAYELSRQMHHKTVSDQWKTKTLALQRRYAPDKKGVGASYAAKIKLLDAQKSFDELKAIRIPQNPKRQQAAAKEKISMVSKLNNELADVVKYDSADEIVGALNMAGQVNLHMGDALVNAPLPTGLNADQQKQYRDGIKKLADPFYAKAKESFQTAVQRGSELDSFPDAYMQARKALVKLDPKALYDGGEMASDVRQASWIGN
jgi:tetratricopeptide (TPR) repeat protein